jgi:hypothetical protein
MEVEKRMRGSFNIDNRNIEWYIEGVGTSIVSKLFWRFVPGVEFKLRWPRGWTEPTPDGVQIESYNPNDHFRPWLEKHVGKQYINWDWAIKDEDLITDTLTIKIRRGRSKYVSMAVMKWG